MKNLIRFALALVTATAAIASENTSSKIWFRQPAAAWSQALPVGNGRLGAMVYGGTLSEQIQLNENTVWSNQPGDFNRAGAYKFLPEIRRLIYAGDTAAAQKLINDHLLGDRPLGAYHPLGDIYLNFENAADASDYRRELDLTTAIVTTSCRAGGATITREVFASAPDQAIIIRITSDKPIGFTAALARIETAETTGDTPDSLTLRGQADRGKPTAGTKFLAHLKIQTDGTLSQQKQAAAAPAPAVKKTNPVARITQSETYPVPAGAPVLRVANATTATLILTAATDYKTAEPLTRAVDQAEAVSQKNYAELRARHLADYQPLYNRSALTLPATENSALPTDKRLANIRDLAADPAFAALFYHYGRYLLIASSRPGNLPANLQGLWNPYLAPPWFSGWHIDINVQMNYWPAEAANLGDLHTPLIDLIADLRSNGEKTAREVFNARGFYTAHRTNSGLFTAPVKGLNVWPVGAAWLAQHLWTHYDYTRDKSYLATRAYPLLKSAASFHLDWLTPNPTTGKLVSGPSISPENAYIPDDKNLNFADLDMGPAMDQQIIAELFDNTLAAAKILNDENDPLINEIKTARAKLADGLQIGGDGRLLEWSTERPEREPGHRHVSHLYALAPGCAITPQHTPELAAAAAKSLQARIDNADQFIDSALLAHPGAVPSNDNLPKKKEAKPVVNISDNSNTGWAVAWNANLWARLHDSQKTYATLQNLFRRCLWPNLMDTHPARGLPDGIFEIDGNLGGTSAIAEMLLQSHAGEIHLLPALPAEWREGNIAGVKARGNYTLNIAWRDGTLSTATLTSANALPTTLRTPTPVKIFNNTRQVAASRPDKNNTHLTTFTTEAATSYRIEAQR